MTLWRTMARAAQSAPSRLPDPDGVRAFLRSCRTPEGGYAGRDGRADLYYTLFGAEAAHALGEAPPEALPAYVATFADGDGLDFVHLACLARLWAAVPEAAGDAAALAGRLAAYRAADGGFAHTEGGQAGTAYGAFLAAGAYEGLGLPLPRPEALADSVSGLAVGAGAYANEAGKRLGLVPATAAAAAVLAHLGRQVPAATPAWLAAQATEGGGFRAMPLAPVADLLSTATAVHALAVTAGLNALDAAAHLAFVEGLRSAAGGYRGHALEPEADCEYTWYALLAAGHLG